MPELRIRLCNMSEDEGDELRQWKCPKCGSSNLIQGGGKKKCENCGYEP